MTVDWKSPIELTDGTPLILKPGSINPDSDGVYYVVRQDRERFTEGQIANYGVNFVIVNADGTEWSENNPPIIYNRKSSQ